MLSRGRRDAEETPVTAAAITAARDRNTDVDDQSLFHDGIFSDGRICSLACFASC